MRAKNVSLIGHLRYRFDNMMARGPIALIGLLFVVSVAFIGIMAAFVRVFGLAPVPEEGHGLGFSQLFWMGLMRTLDAGTMGGDQGSWPFLFSMLVVTLGGIFIVSILIGVITSGIESRIERMRKGRSFVVESDHTVILGWSTQVFTIVSELVEANENRKKPCITVLADKDKVEMEDEIASHVEDLKNTRLVCRSGNPYDLVDLEIVNPHEARSIVVLAPEGDDPDSHVIKTILAITHNPNRRPEPYHIVAPIRDPRNMEVAKTITKGEAVLLLVGDLIARITVQTCRQSGLSIVYTELMDFGGDEIYFQEEPGLVGKTFADALMAYEDSSIMGLRFADGVIKVNPPMTTKIGPGDKVIAISEDDDTVRLSGIQNPAVDLAAIREAKPRDRRPERTLLIGWNVRGPILIKELDAYVSPGSYVRVVAKSEQSAEEIAGRCVGLKNLTLEHEEADTTDRAALDRLDVPSYDHIITLGYSDELGPQEADAKTLVTLLHLRDIAARSARELSIVSEMQDERNRQLAEVARVNDFIVSDKLISLLMAQISENKDLVAVFEDLFDPVGSEIYVKPAEDYVALGAPVSFYTVVESARRRGEIAIGYRIKAEEHDAAKSHGVYVNPDKSGRVTLTAADKIIVIAED